MAAMKPHTATIHNKMKVSEQKDAYCWGRLVCRVSAGWLSQHSMADDSKKLNPAQDSGLMKCLRMGGGRVDRRRVAITKLDAPRLVAGGSDHAYYNWLLGGVSFRLWDVLSDYRVSGSLRVG
jgi:hypothetical protein